MPTKIGNELINMQIESAIKIIVALLSKNKRERKDILIKI
jgi:hypothetical protein